MEKYKTRLKQLSQDDREMTIAILLFLIWPVGIFLAIQWRPHWLSRWWFLLGIGVWAIICCGMMGTILSQASFSSTDETTTTKTVVETAKDEETGEEKTVIYEVEFVDNKETSRVKIEEEEE